MNELQNIYEDFEKHLMEDELPSIYFNRIFKEEPTLSKYPFTMLSDLKKIEQSPKHHPEGNVWNHTMLVVDNGALRKDNSTNPKAFMWAALLHDIGKVPATKIRRGRITAYDHDKFGEKMSKDFLKELGADEHIINMVSKMVRWHMQILFVVKNLPFANIKRMVAETNIDDMALLSLCDRLGRGLTSKEAIAAQEKNVEIFINKCRDYLCGDEL
ncbi:MAG: HD domain-containing protein [Anaeromicrobium sp.]|jgi:putative nucleotidyltransferase with HDIG domain|uniref:HD domain-containing protein n=1 Tax=Anaeromicrobium sp. TaxID=1929132 RepID=UPI0025F0B39C|nr:HD domain-containing protein [Anaeromicrobium sp.]MCT4594134.1 HD domain-containing protein [Anaeromicrobium sp.]